MTSLDLFFTRPEIFETGKVSTLHLLRRDIYSCFGKTMGQIDTNIGTERSIAIWPGIMLILTGIDLLSKFHCGNDTDRQVTTRFKYFVDQYFDADPEDIYQLRNALLHGFSLYSKYKDKEWRYVLGRHCDDLIWLGEDGRISVSADQLHKAFEQSIDRFQKDYSSLHSFSSFNDLFEKYGWTIV